MFMLCLHFMGGGLFGKTAESSLLIHIVIDNGLLQKTSFLYTFMVTYLS